MELLSLTDMSLHHSPSYAGVNSRPFWTTSSPKGNLGLLEQLQTTLDLAQQLQIFSMAAGKLLPLTSVSLQTAMGTLHAPGSFTGANEFHSSLVLQEQCLGELFYQLKSPITANQQRQLYELENQWLFPLRNALIVKRLQDLALKDTLTGLGNRRFFDDAYAKAIHSTQRKSVATALILLDLDNFKKVNDVHGHHTGDEVLQAVADAMRNTIRTTDSLFRLGGDEFAMILVADDAHCAELVGHRLVKAISQQNICMKYGVSASAGGAFYHEGESQQQLFARADAALYQAKHAGKNAVRYAEPSPKLPPEVGMAEISLA